MATEIIKVPELGDAGDVEVIEIPVSVGQTVEENDSLLVLESDKAAMEIPAPMAGTIKHIAVNLGDQVGTGAEILTMESEASAAAPEQPAPDAESGDSAQAPDREQDQEQDPAPEGELAQGGEPDPAPAPEQSHDSDQAPEQDQAEQAAPPPAAAPDPDAGGRAAASVAAASELFDVAIPDLGTEDEVDVIEIHAREGDSIEQEDSLLTLESDKAAMEVPSPRSGTVEAILIEIGAKVKSGVVVARLRVAQTEAAVEPPAPEPGASVDPAPRPEVDPQPEKEQPPAAAALASVPAPTAASRLPADAGEPAAGAGQKPKGNVYAGPAVRKLARELGVDLTRVSGSGARGRIVKEDVHEFVKSSLASPREAPVAAGIPDIDFSRFGEIEQLPRSRLAKTTAANMHRSWLAVAQVAQFEEADVTELEAFRAELKAEAEKRGVKLTPLPFLLKACANCLREFPQFNVSIHSSGEYVIQKKYVHIGIAVATDAGLVVPVVRDVDRKSIWQLAAEVAEASRKARERQLTPDDMQGACFTISSLGNLGGTGFIPIVNAPEVAILGVARTVVKPVWRDGEFVPRTMLPLTLSYDHKALNGVDGGRFAARLAELLGDIRRLLL